MTRVHSMKVLGVMLSENLSFVMHIPQLCCRARQSIQQACHLGPLVVCCSVMVGLCQPKGEVCNGQLDPSPIPKVIARPFNNYALKPTPACFRRSWETRIMFSIGFFL